MSVNRVTLLGYLGSNPDLKYTNSGTPVAKFSLATKESWVDKQGRKNENTSWHKIVCWDRTAENCAKYLEKGSQVYLEGSIKYGEYQGKDGTTKYYTEIVASTVEFLSPPKTAQRPQNAPQPYPNQEYSPRTQGMADARGNLGRDPAPNNFDSIPFKMVLG